jgi:hypothetical protein
MTDYSGYGLVALREECEEQGIKFFQSDTAEELRQKLAPPEKSKGKK